MLIKYKLILGNKILKKVRMIRIIYNYFQL